MAQVEDIAISLLEDGNAEDSPKALKNTRFQEHESSTPASNSRSPGSSASPSQRQKRRASFGRPHSVKISNGTETSHSSRRTSAPITASPQTSSDSRLSGSPITSLETPTRNLISCSWIHRSHASPSTASATTTPPTPPDLSASECEIERDSPADASALRKSSAATAETPSATAAMSKSALAKHSGSSRRHASTTCVEWKDTSELLNDVSCQERRLAPTPDQSNGTQINDRLESSLFSFSDNESSRKYQPSSAPVNLSIGSPWSPKSLKMSFDSSSSSNSDSIYKMDKSPTTVAQSRISKAIAEWLNAKVPGATDVLDSLSPLTRELAKLGKDSAVNSFRSFKILTKFSVASELYYPIPEHVKPSQIDIVSPKGQAWLKEVRRYFRYALSAYPSAKLQSNSVVTHTKNKNALESMLHLIAPNAKGSIKCLRSVSEAFLYMPAYHVLLNDKREEIVISVRGSVEIADFITDAAICPQPNSTVHLGMKKAADWLDDQIYDSLVKPTCKYKRHVKVVLVGHSLGAGVAAILTMKWIDKHADLFGCELPTNELKTRLRCYGFSPPCIVNEAINKTKKYNSFITSITFGCDIVGRLSWGSMQDTLAMVSCLNTVQRLSNSPSRTLTARSQFWSPKSRNMKNASEGSSLFSSATAAELYPDHFQSVNLPWLRDNFVRALNAIGQVQRIQRARSRRNSLFRKPTETGGLERPKLDAINLSLVRQFLKEVRKASKSVRDDYMVPLGRLIVVVPHSDLAGNEEVERLANRRSSLLEESPLPNVFDIPSIKPESGNKQASGARNTAGSPLSTAASSPGSPAGSCRMRKERRSVPEISLGSSSCAWLSLDGDGVFDTVTNPLFCSLAVKDHHVDRLCQALDLHELLETSAFPLQARQRSDIYALM